MIIGSGMIAKVFGDIYLNDPNTCIFASGVSDSKCKLITSYEREKKLLIESLDRYKNKEFVYFSSCSIYDVEKINTAYVNHKLNMEKIVSMHKNHLIVRLPQVIGFSNNRSTILNYLYDSINEGRSFIVELFAYRNLIDVEDVAKVVKVILQRKNRPKKINIANKSNISIISIIQIIEIMLCKKASYKVIKKGNNYTIDIELMNNIINQSNINIFYPDYEKSIIYKYYEKINNTV